jgi:hypothetical protein
MTTSNLASDAELISELVARGYRVETLAHVMDRVTLSGPERAWRFARRNPRSTLAGLTAIAGAFWPAHTAQIAAIAGGLGLILAADAQ